MIVIVDRKRTLLQTAEGGTQVFVVLGMTPVIVLMAILAWQHLCQSHQKKELGPFVKTSSNLAYFPTVLG